MSNEKVKLRTTEDQMSVYNIPIGLFGLIRMRLLSWTFSTLYLLTIFFEMIEEMLIRYATWREAIIIHYFRA